MRWDNQMIRFPVFHKYKIKNTYIPTTFLPAQICHSSIQMRYHCPSADNFTKHHEIVYLGSSGICYKSETLVCSVCVVVLLLACIVKHGLRLYNTLYVVACYRKKSRTRTTIITSTWPQHCSHFLGQINTCFGNMQKMRCHHGIKKEQ